MCAADEYIKGATFKYTPSTTSYWARDRLGATVTGCNDRCGGLLDEGDFIHSIDNNDWADWEFDLRGTYYVT